MIKLHLGGVPALHVSGLAVGLLLVGCAVGGGESSNERPPPADIVVVEDMNSLVLPLDQYIFVRAGETDPILRAQWVLVAKCVQRYGLQWTPPSPRASPENISANYFGLYSKDDARRLGYHREPLPDAESNPGQQSGSAEGPVRPATAPDAEQSDVFKIVKFGRGPKSFAGLEIPEGGCFGEARRQIAEGLPAVADEQFALQLKNEAASDAERDSRVQDAFRSWSSCMKKAGYDYSTPINVLNDPRWSGPTPTPLEISTAIADVSCKMETGLLNIWVAVARAYEQRYVDKNAVALNDLKTGVEAQIKRAIEIVNRG